MTNKVFDAYAAYYNLLYRDKDYRAEAEYVSGLIRQFKPSAHALVDFGCGTGRHAVEFARLGYEVLGVDLSPQMIEIAHQVKETNVEFASGDIRNVRLNRTFDAVLSLFHVMSYQSTGNDLMLAFDTAAAHLNTGGLFIFDCWYGPGVIADPPRVVRRVMADESIEVERLATPTHNQDDHTINVHFEVHVTERASGERFTLHEDHLMRYLFTGDVEHLAEAAGFKIIGAYEWLQREPLDDNKCWNAVFVVEKK